MILAPNVTSADSPVARARALLPLIEACSDQIEIDRQLPDHLVDALHEAGMYRLLLPRSLGGSELDLLTFFEIIQLFAQADAGTAWCVGQTAGCSVSAAQLDPAVARELFGADRAVLAWGPGIGGVAARADVVDGGYRVNGTFGFASGGRQANLFGAVFPVFERDGSQRRDANGKPVLLTGLFPKTQAKIVDVWDVVGLRGTGSDNYALNDVFIPESHMFNRDYEACREPGPLYRFSSVYDHAVAFSAIGLGIARAMLDAFENLAGGKRPTRGDGKILRENDAIAARVGQAEARWRAARAYVITVVRETWEEACSTPPGPIPFERRVEMRMATTHAIQEAREVATTAYMAAGTHAIFKGGPFEHRMRDMYTVCQQIQGHLANFEPVGRHFMGLPVELTL